MARQDTSYSKKQQAAFLGVLLLMISIYALCAPKIPFSWKIAAAQPLLHLTKLQVVISRRMTGQPSSSSHLDAVSDGFQSQACTPSNHIVFLKLHKCASSAIQNLIMRYGDSRNLTFALPREGNYFNHGKTFDRSMLMPQQRTQTKFDIMSHHVRFNGTNMRDLMPSDTKFVTMIRDPIRQFRSLFYYYPVRRRYKLLNMTHPLLEFLSRPDMYYYVHKDKGYVKNNMLFDLGLNLSFFENETAINGLIEEIDSSFYLVMIAERFTESLVVLGRLLCWSLDDLVVFHVNQQETMILKHNPLTAVENPVSDREKRINGLIDRQIRRWNWGDQLLYDHFRRKFEYLIDSYGSEAMTRDKKALEERTKYWYKICVAKTVFNKDNPDPHLRVYHPRTKGFLLTPYGRNNSMCRRLVTPELPYTKDLKVKQLGKDWEEALKPKSVETVKH